MCDGLRKAGAEIRLFFATPREGAGEVGERIRKQYGVATGALELCPVPIRSAKGISPRIAVAAMRAWITSRLKNMPPEAFYSRNLYASVVFAWLCPGRLIYETHQIEAGFRALFQGFVLRRRGVMTIVISQALKRLLTSQHSCSPESIVVEHDGVNDELINREAELFAGKATQKERRFQVGYFGHLYRGRGIDVILDLAARFPDADFWVYGGNDDLVQEFKQSCNQANCHFGGFVSHAKAIDLMRSMDALLMPYQESVAIEATGKSDTSRYMSPMKMFEYMASGVPMVASRLPVLQEVLEDGRNCLLADPRDIKQWESSLRALMEDMEMRRRVATAALNDVSAHYTWVARAGSVLRQFKQRAYR
jgi:glycosyltransferase involved in cell wall biosynthesis